MSLPKIILKQGKAKPFYSRHPWVFAGAISKTEQSPPDGAEVDVYSAEGNFVARGLYNSQSKAKEAFEQLIKNTRAKYILVSYNNEGIITELEMKAILSKYGTVTENFIEHLTYNRMKGIAEYKKNPDKPETKIKECLYLLSK
jgi:adenine-specific DNA methylase